MPSFQYSALNQQGQAVRGVIDAESRPQAIAVLAGRMTYVTEMVEGGLGVGAAGAGGRGGVIGVGGKAAGAPLLHGGASGGGGVGGWLEGLRSLSRRGVSQRQKAAILMQLATAQEAGLPLLQSLRVVEQQADTEAMRELMGDLAVKVQGGESLSGAMAGRPAVFSKLEISMVRVGETAGVLDEVMGYLAEFAERDLDIRERLRSASIYPVLVLVMAGISLVIILTAILPRIINSVSQNVAVLPWPTRMMMGLSAALREWGWLMAIALGLAIWGFRRWLARPEGRLAFDQFKLRIPIMGPALRRIAVARFARTLGTLSKSGIQILEALHVLRDTLGNEVLARKIDQVAASITQGQSIAEPLRETGEFPPLLTQVIALGERTGRLDELLLKAAKTYEKDTANAVQRLTAVLPVILTLLLAVIVLMVLLSVLMPIVMMETSGG